MDRRKAAAFCAAVVCFWLYALAFGSAQGLGLRAARFTGQIQPSAEAAAYGEDTAFFPQAAETAAAAPAGPSLSCRAAILIDQDTGTVLFEKNADERVPIASITKVMTLLLTFEALRDGRVSLEQIVPVSSHAGSMGGSQIWLEPGEQLTLDEMIRAICVSSANDAAVAVAELVGGSEPAFVEQMNAKAAALGMENTSFRNACGLDREGHLSTARDVSVMSRHILTAFPDILHYTGIWTDTLRGGATQLVNTNKLLRRYEGITGLKTGTTGGAGVCISASAVRDGLRLIAVILGAPSSAERFADATALLDYGFGRYEAAAVPGTERAPLRLAVTGSEEEWLPLDYTSVPKTILLPKGEHGALQLAFELPEAAEAPVQTGQTVGRVRVTDGGAVLGEYEVRAAAGAERLTLRGALRLLLEDAAGL